MAKASLNITETRGNRNISAALSFAKMGALNVDLSGPQPVVIAEFGELGRDVVRFPMPGAEVAVAVAMMFLKAREDALFSDDMDGVFAKARSYRRERRA